MNTASPLAIVGKKPVSLPLRQKVDGTIKSSLMVNRLDTALQGFQKLTAPKLTPIPYQGVQLAVQGKAATIKMSQRKLAH